MKEGRFEFTLLELPARSTDKFSYVANERTGALGFQCGLDADNEMLGRCNLSSADLQGTKLAYTIPVPSTRVAQA